MDLEFILKNWGQIFWVIICLWILGLITFSKSGRSWLNAQFEWFKKFFYDEQTHPEYPDHKNLAVLALVATFIVAFLRKLAYSSGTELPDIPQYWTIFLGAAIGFVAVKTSYDKMIERKFRGGNGGDSSQTTTETTTTTEHTQTTEK